MSQLIMNNYAEQYHVVCVLAEQEDYVEAVARAKNDLRSPNLPRYWQIKTCIFIAQVTDDWNEAEKFRVLAEKTYRVFRADVKDNAAAPATDKAAIEELRVDLDELAKEQREQKPEMGDEAEETEEQVATVDLPDGWTPEEYQEMWEMSLALEDAEKTVLPPPPQLGEQAVSAVEQSLANPPTYWDVKSVQLGPVVEKTGGQNETLESTAEADVQPEASSSEEPGMIQRLLNTATSMLG